MAVTVNGKALGGKDLLAYVKRTGDTGYMLIACQVDLNYTKSRQVNSEQSKCGLHKSSGPLDAKGTISGIGFFGIDQSANALSINELEDLIDEDATFSLKLEGVDKDDNVIYYREGDAMLSEVETSADESSNTKFSVNFEFTEPNNITKEQTT